MGAEEADQPPRSSLCPVAATKSPGAASQSLGRTVGVLISSHVPTVHQQALNLQLRADSLASGASQSRRTSCPAYPAATDSNWAD